MNPGMPNSASQISDKVGHLMCYGDGWYGGVYVGAMYSLAFVSDDIQFIVTEALKTIPEESGFYKCIADVIEWYKSILMIGNVLGSKFRNIMRKRSVVRMEYFIH